MRVAEVLSALLIISLCWLVSHVLAEVELVRILGALLDW